MKDEKFQVVDAKPEGRFTGAETENHMENNSSIIFVSLLDGGHFSKEKAILEGGSKLPCTVKIRRFYGKIPGIWLPDHLPLFLRAFTCRTFLEIKIW